MNRFALKHDGRVLLADDMGLGKTVQSLAIAAAYRSEWPLLIVCQLSLRCAWREAVITWLGSSLNLTLSDIHVVESLSDALNKIQHLWSRKLVTIFTYDLLSRYVEKMGPSALTNFKVVIMVFFIVDTFIFISLYLSLGFHSSFACCYARPRYLMCCLNYQQPVPF